MNLSLLSSPIIILSSVQRKSLSLRVGFSLAYTCAQSSIIRKAIHTFTYSSKIEYACGDRNLSKETHYKLLIHCILLLLYIKGSHSTAKVSRSMVSHNIPYGKPFQSYNNIAQVLSQPSRHFIDTYCK